MKIFCECPLGFEAVAAKEVQELIKKRAARSYGGKLFLNVNELEAVKLCYLSQSLERVSVLLLETGFQNLDELEKIAAKLSYSKWIKPENTFAIDCYRLGKHEFKSPDAEAKLGSGVIAAYEKEKGVKLKVNLTKPDVAIRACIVQNKLVLGIDLSGALQDRGYRTFKLRGAINACAAYCMLREAGWKSKQVLLDPFCRDGTVLIEAGLAARRIAQGAFRFSWPFDHFFKPDLAKLKPKELAAQPKLFGFDKSRYARAAKDNAAAAGFTFINIKSGSILRQTLPEPAQYVVTSLPHALVFMWTDKAVTFCVKFLDALRQVTAANAVAVLLTELPDVLEKAVKKAGLKILKKFDVEWYHFKATLFKLQL